jgi:hypothetical protein
MAIYMKGGWDCLDFNMKWPFDKVTFEAIRDALDLPKIYSYFNLPESDVCGKYLGMPGQC